MQKMLEVDRWEIECYLLLHQHLPLANADKEELDQYIQNLEKSYKIGQKIFRQIVDEDYKLSMQRQRLRSELSFAIKFKKYM